MPALGTFAIYVLLLLFFKSSREKPGALKLAVYVFVFDVVVVVVVGKFEHIVTVQPVIHIPTYTSMFMFICTCTYTRTSPEKPGALKLALHVCVYV